MTGLTLVVLVLVLVLVLNCFPIGSFSITTTKPASAITVFSNETDGGYYFCFKIPYLLSLQNGVLIAFAEARIQTCSDFAGTDLVYKRSFDYGQTWGELQLLASNSSSTEANVVGNAAPVQDRNTGDIVIPFCRNNEEVWITRSKDDGETWVQPQKLENVVLSDWKWVGLGPPGGIQLQFQDRLFIPGYHTIKIKGDGELSKGHFMYSDDNGLTWSLGETSWGDPLLVNEQQAVELPSGAIFVNARTVGIHRADTVSFDHGLTTDGVRRSAPGIWEPLEGCEGSTVYHPPSNRLFFSIPNSPSPYRQNLTVFTQNADVVEQSWTNSSSSRTKIPISINQDTNELGSESPFEEEPWSWEYFRQVDAGAVSYSSLAILNPLSETSKKRDYQTGDLVLLYERSDDWNLVFLPQEIVFVKVSGTNK